MLRDRLITLLENADEVWGTYRRPWRPLHVRADRAGVRSKRGALACKIGVARSAHKDSQPGHCSMPTLDSGAGPRRFWEAMAGPRFIEPSWNVDIEVSR